MGPRACGARIDSTSIELTYSDLRRNRCASLTDGSGWPAWPPPPSSWSPACSSTGASSSPAASAAAIGRPSAAAPSSAASVAPSTAAGDPNDLLAKIKAAGVIRVGTDPAYPPQSELKADGTFEGFDIDTANEIGKRLGVKVKFETPDFSVVEAGKWAGRFDVSVGSVTITKKRLDNLDFTDPYYFTPAQMAATTASGITTLEGLAGKTVCVGEATTYFQWINGDADARRRIRARAGPGRDEGHDPQDRRRTARCRSSPAARTSKAG